MVETPKTPDDRSAGDKHVDCAPPNRRPFPKTPADRPTRLAWTPSIVVTSASTIGVPWRQKKSAKGELNHPLKSGDIEIFLWVDEPIFRLYHSISWRVALLARRIGVISHSGGDPRRTARFSIQTGHLHSNIQTLY